MKHAFTLIEMLIVLGIIAVLTGASLAGYSQVRKAAERARARELCLQVKTAFEAIWNEDGVWPKAIRDGNRTGLVDENVAYELARRNKLALSYSDGKVTGIDQFGVVTPWAADALRRRGGSMSLSTPVGKATVKDHILHYAVDLDGDGIIDSASVGGQSVDIRATCAVWCCGRDGKLRPYREGLKDDDVYTWTPGQTKNVK